MPLDDHWSFTPEGELYGEAECSGTEWTAGLGRRPEPSALATAILTCLVDHKLRWPNGAEDFTKHFEGLL